MLRNLFLCMAVFVSTAMFAKTELRFNQDGEFKIVQFTDTHFKVGKDASKAAVECISEVLVAEQPDMVMLTGDVVWSDSVIDGFKAILRPILERKIPFAFVFGNHDAQFELDHAQIYDFIQPLPYSLMPVRTPGVDSPDYAVEILSSKSDSVASVLYCLDSHMKTPIKGIGKYAWLKPEQVMWYKDLSWAYQVKNDGDTVPSLMFFHIPIPEVAAAWEDNENMGYGTKGENVCCPALNSGMFTAVKERGDVFGMFFGHDHDNDFAVDYYDVLLGYGRYSGGNTVYNHLGKNGARIIVLKEGEKTLDTWVRLRDDEIIDKASFPSDFKGKKRKKKK